MVIPVKDSWKLLAGLPKGAWVALSKDEDRLIAYHADLNEAVKMAKEAGETDPVVLRVPENGASLVL